MISKHLAHPALVSEADFVAAQQITALPAPRDSGVQDYRLAGLLRCRSCRRRLDSCWSHGRAAYRCRHGHTSAKSHGGGGESNLYVREDVMIDVIRGLLPDRSGGWICLQMVQHLRRQRLVVSCAEFACSLEPMFPARPPLRRYVRWWGLVCRRFELNPNYMIVLQQELQLT